MKVALIQMRVGMDRDGNIADACRLIRQAAAMGIDMAVLPEMFCCPYSGDYFHQYSEPEGGPAQTALAALAAELGILIIGGSLPERSGDKVYNTSYVYNRQGEQIAKHRKVHLFDVNIKGGVRFMESETLAAGDAVTTFDTEFGTMGLCICFDFRFEELGRVMALRGAKAIFVPAAFNMTTGPAHWELMFRQRAVDNQVFTLGAAPARDTGGVYVSYGNSIAVTPWGEVLARCAGDPCTLFVDLDLSQIDSIREQLPIMKGRRADLYMVEDCKGGAKW